MKTKFSTQETKRKVPKWLEDLIKPEPTWYTLDDYRVARGMLLSRPPSEELLEPDVKSYLAGLTEGEGYEGYRRLEEVGKPAYIHAIISVGMCDPAPMEFMARMLNIKASIARAPPRKDMYLVDPSGLRGILYGRVIYPVLKGIAKDKTLYITQHGYRVSEEIADKFIEKFGGKRWRRKVEASEEFAVEELWLSPSERGEDIYRYLM